ncbi:MAG: CrcB family protein [Rikenellaceae bacterium]
MLRDILLVVVGSGIGGGLRYLINVLGQRLLPASYLFFTTMLVNVVGSFVIGLIFGALVLGEGRGILRPLLAVGFCGGFTTFSTFSAEGISLLQRGDYLLFGLYVIASVTLSLLAFYFGYYITGDF